MSTTTILLAVGVTLVAVAVGIGLRRISGAWWTFRGVRVVSCPENRHPAAVRVDAAYAAATAAGGAPRLRLSGCSRWPERDRCGQECVNQIRSAPDDCRVLSILTKFYADKYCGWCGRPVDRAYWTSCKPALLVGTTSKEWDEIPVTELPEVLMTARPVCFECHRTSRDVRAGAQKPTAAL